MSFDDTRHLEHDPSGAAYRAPQFGSAPRARTSSPTPPVLRSQDLFRGGHHELLIEHRGECYRLRLTRQDKLILNK